MSVPTGPPLLDQAILARYEALLRKQKIPLDDWAKPGLTREQMTELAAPLPFKLPVEARTWCAWRDGVEPGGRSWVFGPRRDCLSLARASVIYGRSRVAMRKSATEPGLSGPRSDPDFMWRPGWLPILDHGQLKTAIDCAVAEGEPSEVSFIDFATQPEEYARHKARSFGEMICWWSLALERGAWSWDIKREA